MADQSGTGHTAKQTGGKPSASNEDKRATEWLETAWKQIDASSLGSMAFSMAVNIKFNTEFFIKKSTIRELVAAGSMGRSSPFRRRAHERELSSQDMAEQRKTILWLLLGLDEDHAAKSDNKEVLQAATIEERQLIDEIHNKKNMDIAKDPRYFKALMQELIAICFYLTDAQPTRLEADCDFVLYRYLCHLCKGDEDQIYTNYADGQPGDYFYRIDKIKLTFVESVPDYLREIIALNNDGLYFRGHSDSAFYLVPSIFRNESHRRHESEMCEELRRLSPTSFQGMHTQLDRLVEMQHYELPTRLLDISLNALVALLFTCDDTTKDGQDGEVVILDSHGQYKYGQSDTVTMLSLLSTLNYGEERVLYYASILFSIMFTAACDKRALRDAEKQVLKQHSAYLRAFSGQPCEVYATNAERIYQETLDEAVPETGAKFQLSGEEIINRFNGIRVVSRFVRQIQVEKPYFKAEINPGDLARVLFVKPTMLNNRIVKQSGAFLLCGQMSNDLLEIAEAMNRHRFKGKVDDSKIPVIIVPARAKKAIRKELGLCDLHQAAIYPEIDKVAKHIRNRFS